MPRSLLPLIVLFSVLTTSRANSTDYIIHVETTGYVNAEVKPDSPEPEEHSLRTIETLCRIGQPFRARMTVGNETTTLSGVLKESDDAAFDFSVKLKQSHIVDTGSTVPVAPGVEQKVLNVTSSNTTVAVVQGEPLKIGGPITSSTDTTAAGQTGTTKSRHYCTVTVEEYDPTADER